jgi:hypothetical protein
MRAVRAMGHRLWTILAVDELLTLASVLGALFRFYEEKLQQVQAEAQSASTTKSALRMVRWESSCPIAKPSSPLIVAYAPPRAERGNAARLRLYFVGYVTAYPTECKRALSAR